MTHLLHLLHCENLNLLDVPILSLDTPTKCDARLLKLLDLHLMILHHCLHLSQLAQSHALSLDQLSVLANFSLDPHSDVDHFFLERLEFSPHLFQKFIWIRPLLSL